MAKNSKSNSIDSAQSATTTALVARTITNKAGETVNQIKCKVCGKWMTRPDSVEAEEGHLCLKLDAAGVDRKAEHSARVGTEFAGMVRTADLHKVCKILGIPVARMVKAFGGDRGINPPSDARFTFKYGARNARFVSEWAATTEGLTKIAGRNVPANEAVRAVTSIMGKEVAQKLYSK